MEVTVSEIVTPLAPVKITFLRSSIKAGKQLSGGTEVFFLSAELISFLRKM
jgi:hypothetical protein